MTNIQIKKKRNNANRNVFRKPKPIRKSKSRQLLEAIILLIPSIVIFYFLQLIPNKYDLDLLLSSTLTAYTNFAIAFIQAFKGTLLILLILLAALTCIALFLGSAWRLIKLSSKRFSL